MSSSREESPDWLRSFQPPAASAICLSSGSESPGDLSPRSEDEDDDVCLSKLFKKEVTPDPITEDDDDVGGSKYTSKNTLKGKSPVKKEKVKVTTPGRKRKSEDDVEKKGKITKEKDAKRKLPEKQEQRLEKKHSVLALSSDSESSADTIRVRKDKTVKKELSTHDEDQISDNEKHNDVLLNQDGEFQRNGASKVKSPEKKLESVEEKNPRKKNIVNDDNKNTLKEEITMNQSAPQTSYSRLPLLLSEKVQRTKALVECEGDAIDLSGDMGSIGRVVISDDHSKNHDMLLDLKGTIYKTTIVPSRTFCVVSFGQSEAKIEAIMNDYIQLKPQSNVYEAETMVEGTLDGFSFDSEDEAENQAKATAQADQDEATEEKPAGTTKRKAEKATGTGRNKGKTVVGGKPSKKVKKKPQVSKKSKTKK